MKIRAILLALVALAGMSMGAVTVARTNDSKEPAAPVAQPVKNPYEEAIAAAGIVEPQSEEVAIGAPLPGLVTELMVAVGARVEAGAPLFRVDSRAARARLLSREAERDAAAAELARLEALPRDEQRPPAQAAVAQAEAQLADAEAQLRTVETITDPRAVSQEVRLRRKAAVAAAQAALARARAELALLEAGAWERDRAIARAQLRRAEAAIAEVQTELDMRLVKAPFDGEVLQLNLRLGEYAAAGPLTEPLVIFGATATLHIRADIDEYDAWRFDASQPAMAMLRGNPKLRTQLRYVRTEPLVIPKRSLTGAPTERVDTRVMQVIYAFEPSSLAARPGQQVDLYIRARSDAATSGGR